MRIIRVRFSKTGDAAYISHLDLQRVMHRAMAKAGLPAWYSQGFNPHIYLTFPLPLPLGQYSTCEAMDFKTEDEALPFAQVVAALNTALPTGLCAHSAAAPVHAAKDIAFADYLLELPALPGVEQALAACDQSQQILITKTGKQDGRKTVKQVDLKPLLPTLCWHREGARLLLPLTVAAGSSVNVNPAALVGHLQQLCGQDLSATAITRRQILTTAKEEFR